MSSSLVTCVIIHTAAVKIVLSNISSDFTLFPLPYLIKVHSLFFLIIFFYYPYSLIILIKFLMEIEMFIYLIIYSILKKIFVRMSSSSSDKSVFVNKTKVV